MTRSDGVVSRHSFSFGSHYDPGNVRHGVLVAHNEEELLPGAGYGDHTHRDAEVVTWVLEGRLAHRDSSGNSGVLVPGTVQRMSAGTGVVHSERNARTAAPGAAGSVRFVQMWVQPDRPAAAPSYAQHDVSGLLSGGDLVPVVSGLPGRDAPVRLGNRSACLHAVRLGPGEESRVPDAPYLHVFVARGSVRVEGAGVLQAGDEVRITGGGGHRLTGEPAGGEVLVWEMHSGGR